MNAQHPLTDERSVPAIARRATSAGERDLRERVLAATAARAAAARVARPRGSSAGSARAATHARARLASSLLLATASASPWSAARLI